MKKPAGALTRTTVSRNRRDELGTQPNPERCAICNCLMHRSGDYAQPTALGRSHATSHHHVAERFFGRSANRRGEIRDRLFEVCPWDCERQQTVLCYECHEELVHNPVLLPDDIAMLAHLVQLRGLAEDAKTDDRSCIAGRVQLFHEVIARGLQSLLAEEKAQ